jgi:hypothetical protein
VNAELDPGHRLPEEEPPADQRPPRRAGRGSSDPGPGQIGWLVGGAIAIAAGTALGWNATAVSEVVTPPPLVRAALVGVSFAAGIVLLLTALSRLAESSEALPPPVGYESERDIAGMIRAVRLVFLAVAAFAAAAGWMIGHPLPLVVALVIAGVDILETSFLLVVVALRSSR